MVIEIVSFPINSMVISIAMLVYLLKMDGLPINSMVISMAM